MDTSTRSMTDVADSDSAPPALTSILHSDRIQPGVDWFARLISPLTGHSAEPSAVPSVVKMAKVDTAWTSEEIMGKVAGKALVLEQMVPVHMDQDQAPYPPSQSQLPPPTQPTNGTEMGQGVNTMLLVFIPILAVFLTVVLGLLVFLVVMVYMKRRRTIRLTEDGGPLDLSKGDGVIGEGGVDGVESRWLEGVEPDVRQAYRHAKDWQAHNPPASLPSEITLSQFLSIQEKGVSAWSFEPDYEDNLSLYVQSRTEITFLADGPGMPAREGGGNSVMANLPLPKLNEVYYWEVKMYDKPANTEVAVGLATKPYPSFRLPGWCRYSVAYFASDGFKSHNYPFTASSHGPPLNEGDVLGVGYRPRTGTVFFTRNGKKMEDAYAGLQRFNLFPTIGANGPCTIHVNLGQAGFVFIEANVKKWGLAPMTGTLAPPPAYGSEGGSILLDAGYGTPSAGQSVLSGVGALLEAARNRTQQQLSTSATSTASRGTPIPASPGGRPIPTSPVNQTPRSNSSRRHRRAGKATNLAGSVPAISSPLRTSEPGPGPTTAGSRRRALGRIGDEYGGDYVSPTDTPLVAPRIPSPDALERLHSDDEDVHEDSEVLQSPYHSDAESEGTVPDSPLEHNPPTPNLLDISLHSIHPRHYFGGRQRRDSASQSGSDGSDDEDDDERGTFLTAPSRRSGGGSGSGSGSGESDDTLRATRPLGPPGDSPPPPGYAPLDPHMYATGLPADLPEDLVNQAIAAMSSEPGHPAAAASSASSQPPPTPTPIRNARGGSTWFNRG